MFTDNDKQVLRREIKDVNIATVKLNKYSYNRFKNRLNGIKWVDVARVFKNNNIIEYNTENNDKRILLRGKQTINNNNICIVYSLKYNMIITVWLNHKNNNHNNLNQKLYNKNLKIKL